MKGIDIDTSLPWWFYVVAAAGLFIISVVVWGTIDFARWLLLLLKNWIRSEPRP